MAWNDILSAYVLDQVWGYQSANKLRENILVLAGARFWHDLGGSRQVGQRVAVYTDAVEWRDRVLDGTRLGGLTTAARVERRTFNVATSVRVRVRNVTDATVAGEGAIYSADTNWAAETFTVTIANGVKTYRLQVLGGNANNDIFAVGGIELYA